LKLAKKLQQQSNSPETTNTTGKHQCQSKPPSPTQTVKETKDPLVIDLVKNPDGYPSMMIEKQTIEIQ
jgi:hypothetical protein